MQRGIAFTYRKDIDVDGPVSRSIRAVVEEVNLFVAISDGSSGGAKGHVSSLGSDSEGSVGLDGSVDEKSVGSHGSDENIRA